MFGSVRHAHVVISAICIFELVSLLFVRVLYFSCCNLLSVEDEFLVRCYILLCVKMNSFPFR